MNKNKINNQFVIKYDFTDNGILSLFEKFFQKNDIFSSLMQMISKLNEKSLEDEKIKIYGEQYLTKPKNYQTNEKILRESKARAAKKVSKCEFFESFNVVYQEFSCRDLKVFFQIQLDEPISISSESFNVDNPSLNVPKGLFDGIS